MLGLKISFTGLVILITVLFVVSFMSRKQPPPNIVILAIAVTAIAALVSLPVGLILAVWL